MKKLLGICAALMMALGTLTVHAATNVTGSWTGAMNGGQGGINLTFTFKQDGATLTGTVDAGQGQPIAMSEGKVDGDKISFKVVIQGGTAITHEGTINAAGDDQADLQVGQWSIPGRRDDAEASKSASRSCH